MSGTHDLSFETAIYSPPLADSWRLFGGYRFAEGNFEEGKGSRRQLFAGIEWRPRDYWGELELQRQFSRREQARRPPFRRP